MGEAQRIPRQVPLDAEPRLRRLRGLAWLLDRSIGVGPKGRFGVDPLLGLVPGVGDWLGAVLSLYIVYEAMRLGVRWPVLGRMIGNVALESLVGVVPLAGDMFDFFWQANARNLRLVEENYTQRLQPRSFRAIALFFGVLVLFVIAGIVATVWFAAWLLRQLNLFGS